MDSELTVQVLAVLASVLIGAVAMAWTLYKACLEPRPPRPRRPRSAAHPAGRHRPETVRPQAAAHRAVTLEDLATPNAATASPAWPVRQAVRREVARHQSAAHRYLWPARIRVAAGG